MGQGVCRALVVVMVVGLSLGLGVQARAQDEDTARISWERQVAYIETLIAAEPSVPLHYMRLAQAYARLGREGEVLRFSDEAVRRGGNALAADILVGDFYFSQGRYEDALSRYIRVLDASPRQSHVLVNTWMIIQRSRSDQVGLRANLEPIIRMLNNAGYHMAVTSQVTNAAAAQARVIEGNRLLNENRIPDAVRAYKDAAELDPWNPDIYRNLGIAFARSQDQLRAVGAYELYIALAPPDRQDVPRVRKIITDYHFQQTR